MPWPHRSRSTTTAAGSRPPTSGCRCGTTTPCRRCPTGSTWCRGSRRSQQVLSARADAVLATGLPTFPEQPDDGRRLGGVTGGRVASAARGRPSAARRRRGRRRGRRGAADPRRRRTARRQRHPAVVAAQRPAPGQRVPPTRGSHRVHRPRRRAVDPPTDRGPHPAVDHAQPPRARRRRPRAAARGRRLPRALDRPVGPSRRCATCSPTPTGSRACTGPSRGDGCRPTCRWAGSTSRSCARCRSGWSTPPRRTRTRPRSRAERPPGLAPERHRGRVAASAVTSE